ncbi:hypothetical protein VPH35_093185 [Triticum aestivum]
MAATLLRRALQLRRALPSPASSRALLPAASSRLLSVTASTQQNTAGTAIDLSNDESRRRLVNSLMYRSKQRGFLELDLVLGTWVEQHVRSMDEANIRSLLQILDLIAVSNLRPFDSSGEPRLVEMAYWSRATARDCKL